MMLVVVRKFIIFTGLSFEQNYWFSYKRKSLICATKILVKHFRCGSCPNQINLHSTTFFSLPPNLNTSNQTLALLATHQTGNWCGLGTRGSRHSGYLPSLEQCPGHKTGQSAGEFPSSAQDIKHFTRGTSQKLYCQLIFKRDWLCAHTALILCKLSQLTKVSIY